MTSSPDTSEHPRSCDYCGAPWDLGQPNAHHVMGERKCCPDCRHYGEVAGMSGDCRGCGRLILPDERICGFVPYRGWLCDECCHEVSS